MGRQTRSQRMPQASQSQPPRATQGRRSRRTQVEDESEGDHDAHDAYNGDGGDEDGGQGEVDRKARDLVRLALFHEQRRVPLRRDEIVKKVLGTNARLFNTVLPVANDILKKTFGMELVQLQALPSDKDISEQDADLLKNTGIKKKAASSGTKSYILRSLLDPVIIEQACSPDAEIRELEQEENKHEDEELAEDDNPIGTRSTGSIFAWHASDELASVGILYVILALILVEGRVISDSDLRNILKRLQLPSNVPVPLSSQTTNQSLTVDAYLAQLTRQGYLEKLRVGNTTGKGGQKRARSTQATAAAAGDDSSLQAFEWRWGPRALTEVGERAVAQFVAEFMVGQPGQEDGEEDGIRAAQDEGTQKRVEIIIKGIERAAAGGELFEVK